MVARGFRGNLGDPVISTDVTCGVWVAAFNNTLAQRCASAIAWEQSHRRNRGTVKRRKTKRGGTDGRES